MHALLRTQVTRECVRASVEHDHAERNRQGLGNELMKPGDDVGSGVDQIESRERLGGMLKSYHRRAAERDRDVTFPAMMVRPGNGYKPF
ncbi:MAG: hypothetical protein ABGZ17_14145 [Planctomycetaceae bacterium]